jgi:TolB-like protein/class 3 adenylate cyclase/Tfp pilus assembly protein PilF
MMQEVVKPPRFARRLRAVLFADVVDSVRLIQHDEEGTIRRWRDFVAVVTGEELPRRQGRMVKSQGDGMLLEFESAVDAVECALAMQARITTTEDAIDPDRRIRLRVAVHLADVITDEIDIYGDGVNLAARLRDLGGPAEIIISAAVRDQLADGLGVTIEDLGERTLKGMERPVRAFRAWPLTSQPTRGSSRLRHAGDRPAIAVLPFRNLSSDPAHDFLGDLFAEDLIGDLSRHTDLFVISRLSTRPFRDRLYELRNVADVLGVRYVLSGNVQTSGARVRLMAELTEAEAGRVIWAENFDGTITDIFELQDRLSQDIASRAMPFLRQLELQRARSKRREDLTAYEWTLRAVDHFHRSSHEDMDSARAMFEAAIKVDPLYVTPYAWLAHWYVRRVGQGWSEDRKRDTSEATRYAERAVEIDSTDPLALTVSGLVEAYLKKDLETAMTRYDRALAINPSASSAWVWSTSACSWLGQGDEAVRRSHRAIELSPFDPLMYTFTSIAGTAHTVAGQYDRAIEMCRRSLRQNRMFASTHRTLTISLALAGRVDEARLACAELLKLEPTLTVGGFQSRYPGSASPQAKLFSDALATAGVPG